MRNHCLFVLLFISFSIQSQIEPEKSLEEFSDEQLLVQFSIFESDTIKALKFANDYLTRGKRKNDTIQIARGYDRLSRISDLETALKFSDSIILLTSTIRHKTYPGLGYLLKGSYLQEKRDYPGALDYFTKANVEALKHDNYINRIYLQKRIIELKSRWSNPKEGIELCRKFLSFIDTLDYYAIYRKSARADLLITDDYIKDMYHNDKIEINSMLTTAYIINKDFEFAFQNANRNLSYIDSLDIDYPIEYIHRRLAEIEYYRGNYKKSIDTFLDYGFSEYVSNSRLNYFYYLGMNSIKLGNEEIGLDYLLKADAIFEEDQNILPSQRNLLVELYNHYSSNENKVRQIEFLNKILIVDSIFKSSYQKINSTIIKEFETPQLIAEKEKLIAQLEWEKGREQRQSAFIAILLVLSIGTGIYYFAMQRKYKKRFKSILKDGLEGDQNKDNPEKRNGISAVIVDDILKQLEVFEAKHKYISQSVSLQSVAKKFGTNSSYLSKVINLKKDKNFSQYISELRISYAVNELKNNPRFRKYTIKAIAQEVGFGNAQSFSKAFYARTGLHPSYFIRNLKKQQQRDHSATFTLDSIPQRE